MMTADTITGCASESGFWSKLRSRNRFACVNASFQNDLDRCVCTRTTDTTWPIANNNSINNDGLEHFKNFIWLYCWKRLLHGGNRGRSPRCPRKYSKSIICFRKLTIGSFLNSGQKMFNRRFATCFCVFLKLWRSILPFEMAFWKRTFYWCGRWIVLGLGSRTLTITLTSRLIL